MQASLYADDYMYAFLYFKVRDDDEFELYYNNFYTQNIREGNMYFF
jgi:hypothetical protein